MPMKALVPVKIDFFRWRSRNDECSTTRQLTTEANGELSMHFRIYDLAADRCVWSIPPIDTVPVLRAQCGSFCRLVGTFSRLGSALEFDNKNRSAFEHAASRLAIGKISAERNNHETGQDGWG
jgi:hypothetical protein